ncbi:beta-ketoacyl-ACP synthase II [Candidatus Margulisiibacteriota bacterium]
MSKRVVITGLGTINPGGNNVDSYWKTISSGTSCVNKIEDFDVSEFTTHIAAQVKNFNPEDHFDKKEVRRTSKFILYALVAVAEAVKDSGLDIEKEADEIGVEIGSGIGGIEILQEAAIVLKERGPSKISPFSVPMMICDMASGMVAIKFGAKGPNSCSVTACASATHSLGNAYKLVRDGVAVAMIAGGTEAAIHPLGLGCFCAARSLSTRNDDPKGASRPFDLNRDGFIMGDGSGILILEELEHAKARGAKIYAEIVGFGSSGDAYHITAPAPEGAGAARAMKQALDLASVKPEQIDYINAHGTSTSLNDKNESTAIRTVFGEYSQTVSISSTKSMTGHLLGAAGAIELIAVALSIQNNLIPPTINYSTPDPECDLNYTPNKAKNKDIEYAISNSFGFGGHNAVLVARKYR